MLRVTPIYGSQWSSEGQAEEPTCTLVEYGDCRVLLNVGWVQGEETANFPLLPDHDCLLLTDSSLQSMGGLPLYYHQQEQKRKRRQRRRRKQQQQQQGEGGQERRLDDVNGAVVSSSSPREAEDDDDVMDDADEEEEKGFSPMPSIYATFPIVKMGQMTLYDHHANLSFDGGRPPFTLLQIDNAISSIQSIKYSQQILLHSSSNKNNINSSTTNNNSTTLGGTEQAAKSQQHPTLSITAHRAGHCVGGSFFVLQRLQDETTVVLTKTFHIAKELHLDSSTLLKHATTPDVLVTYPGGPALAPFKALATPPTTTATVASSSSSSAKAPPPPVLAPQLVAQVERKLTETILAVLRRNGNVLLPVDAASRSLELLVLLNRHWERHRLKAAYNLVWLGPMAHNTVDFAKSQLEWMSETLLLGEKTSNSGGGGKSSDDPANTSGKDSSLSSSFLLFQSIQFCATVNQVEQLMQQNPTCVLATGLDLEHGPARNILLLLADNPDNAIFFTDSSQAYLRTSSSKAIATTTTSTSTP